MAFALCRFPRTSRALLIGAVISLGACSGGGGSPVPVAGGAANSVPAATTAPRVGANGNPTDPPGGGVTNPSSQPTNSPSSNPSGNPDPTPTPRPGDSATPTHTPTPAPGHSAAPTPTPVPTSGTGGNQIYNPPVGVAPYFASSPFQQRIPNPPTVSANSATWVGYEEAQGSFSLGNFWAYTSLAPNPDDLEFPAYMNHQGANIPVRIHCTADFGGPSVPCNVEGMTVYVDPRELPQNGGCIGNCWYDAHWALVDPVAGYEYTLWQTKWPPQNGVLTASWGGRCLLSGDGFTNPSYSGPSWNSGCGGTASSTPLTMGVVRASDLLAAAANGGVLPSALNISIGCTGKATQLPAPFLSGGDGQCNNAPMEGNRMYLAMHDAQVNQLGATPIISALLRTLDEDHYGGFVTDSGGGPSAMIGINVESDSTYAAFGDGTPWLSQFLPEAEREGLPTFSVPSQNRIGISMTLPAGIGWAQMRFL